MKMGERLYSINEFLLSNFDEDEDEQPALLTQHSTSTITTQKSESESTQTPRGNFGSSVHSIPRLSFHSAQSGADSDSVYTEDDSSLDGSCTFLEFLKEMDTSETQFQNKKDDFSDFLYQVTNLSNLFYLSFVSDNALWYNGVIGCFKVILPFSLLTGLHPGTVYGLTSEL